MVFAANGSMPKAKFIEYTSTQRNEFGRLEQRKNNGKNETMKFNTFPPLRVNRYSGDSDSDDDEIIRIKRRKKEEKKKRAINAHMCALLSM